MNLKWLVGFAILFLCISVSASTEQDATGVMIGNENSQQTVLNVHGVAMLSPNIDASSATYNFNNDPSIFGLDVGRVDESILVYPGEVVTYPVSGYDKFYIRSGTPVAVYTIGTGDDRLNLESSESMLTYDPYYHRFDHGVVIPVKIFPRFTTKCAISAEGAKWVVIDNRYFPAMTMVEIIPDTLSESN